MIQVDSGHPTQQEQTLHYEPLNSFSTDKGHMLSLTDYLSYLNTYTM